MKARLHTQIKQQLADGSTISIVIWSLPGHDANRPCGYKYRLNYSLPDGTTAVRYDNERGKGDHRHLGHLQLSYEFANVEQLVKDFLKDVRAQGGRL